MNVYRRIVVFILMLCTARDVQGDEPDVAAVSIPGKAFEIILTKLEHLQGKIVELESAMKQADLKLSDDMSKLSQTIDEKLSGVVGVIHEQNRTIDQMSHKVFALQAQSKVLEHTVNTQHKQMAKEIETLVSKSDVALMMISSGLNAQNISFISCTKYPSYLSGKYMIQPTQQDVPFLGYCDQTVFGGGWLVFQYRYDGSVDFFRNWTEYRDGFGSVDGEFWLGLERLHRITSARPHELLVELKDFNGTYSYARYDVFQIGNQEGQYTLQKLGRHTGTAEDALDYHRGEKFSTVDRDNDSRSRGNCASELNGAWWYRSCADSNLNGPYRNNNDILSMDWGITDSKSHSYTRMMIREK